MAAPSVQPFETIARDLHAHGWSVLPGFLGPAEVALLRHRARQWWQEGEFRHAGVGRGHDHRLASELRGDLVRWLDLETGGRFRDLHDTWYEPLRLALNQQLYLGLFELEAHVAMYPPGAFYVRHLDRFRDDPRRVVTVILYLNERWSADDGGALRMYLPTEGGPDGVHEVLPEAGTLVTFLSGEIWHEVLPTRRERLSLTGWYGLRR